MTLLEATSHLIDAAKTWCPRDDKMLTRAIKRMEKRLEVLQFRKATALRRRRHKAWELMQHLRRDCQHCGFDFCFGDFVKTAEIDHRQLVRFDCPACEKLVVVLEVEKGIELPTCERYMIPEPYQTRNRSVG